MARTMIIGPRGGIAVDDAGPGSTEALPVVLLHGATGSARHWEPVAERLRASRRVIVPDLPGHGLSDPPQDVDWSTEAFAEALHLVIEERHVPRFVLVGHSLAGNVVAQYAAVHPGRVSALCFLDTGSWVPSAAELDELRRGFRPESYDGFVRDHYDSILAGAQPSTRDAVLRGLRAMPRENFMALMYGSMGFDMRAAVAHYPGPKLALCAEEFGVGARWGGTDVAVRTLSGVSHWLHLDAPDEVARALEEWMKRFAC